MSNQYSSECSEKRARENKIEESRNKSHERIVQNEEIYRRSQEFRRAIDILLSCSNNTFLKSVVKKCSYFGNCCEPFEVISEAYLIGQAKILRGEEIPNPEAWMRVTIWNILHGESKAISNREKHYTSLDYEPNDSEGVSLIDITSNPAGSDNSNELERTQAEHARVKKAFRRMSVNERKILNALIAEVDEFLIESQTSSDNYLHQQKIKAIESINSIDNCIKKNRVKGHLEK